MNSNFIKVFEVTIKVAPELEVTTINTNNSGKNLNRTFFKAELRMFSFLFIRGWSQKKISSGNNNFWLVNLIYFK